VPSPFIFVDTGAWYAYVDKSDAHHPAATQFIHTLTTPLATSTYILDETVTLIKAHLGHRAAVLLGEKLRQEQIAKLLRITEQDEQRAWEIFVRYHDKGFSFTDCTSFALMERLQIDTAFAFDEHSRQYGKFVVVPS
jgi:predicted nucleic acid-binding protein